MESKLVLFLEVPAQESDVSAAHYRIQFCFYALLQIAVLFSILLDRLRDVRF